MEQPTPIQAHGPIINRIADVMMHCTRYSARCAARLAEDAGVDASSISRLVNGRSTDPSFRLIARVTTALERELHLSIDPRDIAAEGGAFLHRYCCTVAGCRGCIPYAAHDEFHRIRPEFLGIAAGQWVSSRYPHGFAGREAL